MFTVPSIEQRWRLLQGVVGDVDIVLHVYLFV